MASITWLHLSDLHFRQSHAFDENIILNALMRDVAERIQADNLCPDFIAVTGDIAFSGKPAEYAMARAFFDDLLVMTGLPRERLFLVPGNHDVDRSLITLGAEAIGAALTNRDRVNTLLNTLSDRRLVLARFKGYAEFVNDYLASHLSFDDERYFYVRTVDFAGQRIALLGLNSAWLSASDKDKVNGLLIGERQARAALEQAEGVTLKIVLLHHPFDWLREFDQNDSAAMLLDNCDFILHGHLHRTGMAQLVSPDAAAMVIAAGACYETREYPNLYNFVRLDFAVGTGAVYLRRYSDERGGFWTKDTLSYRNVPDSMYAFALPRSLSLPITLGLPDELYYRFRATLLECNEFDSDASLRAIFVTNELYSFRSGLPSARSKTARVDACLDYLLLKRLSDGRPVLPLFLAALRDRYHEGTALRDELEMLYYQLLAPKVIMGLQSIYRRVELDPADVAQATALIKKNDLFKENGLCFGCAPTSSPQMYYVSCDFEASRADYLRKAIESSLKAADLRFQPYYPRKDDSPGHLLCKSIAHIAASSFCLFDLSPLGGTNVFLEIGLAIGMRKSFALIRSQGMILPEYLADLDKEEYRTYTESDSDLFSRSKLTLGRFPELHISKTQDPNAVLVAYGGGTEAVDFVYAVSAALSRYQVRPVDLNQLDLTSLFDLVSHVQQARFGIYRVDVDADPTTFIALGIALALNKPALLLSREGSYVPDLLRGLTQVGFRSFGELEQDFTVKAGDFLLRHVGSQIVEDEQTSPRFLRSVFERSFDLEELKTLSQDLGIDFDSLKGEGKSIRARELVALLQREGRLRDLVTAYKRYRPRAFTEIVPLFENQWSNCVASIQNPQEFAKCTGELLESFTKALDLRILDPNRGVSHNCFQAFKIDITPAVTDTRLPETLPFVFLRRFELRREDLEGLRHLLTEKLHISHRTVIVIVLDDQIDPRSLGVLDEGDIFAYDMILASRMEIQPILVSPDPQRALRRLLFAHMDLAQVSPFVFAGPTRPDMFFGREKEIKEIITTTSVGSVALVGGRRIGKTSILQRVEHIIATTESEFLPYYLDCQAVEEYDDLFAKMKTYWQEWGSLEASPNGFVKMVINLQQPGRVPLFLLDEVDQLLLFDEQHKERLFKTFRSLSQERRCQFVFSGEKVLIQRSRDSSSPLFNFCQILPIGYLGRKSARRLLVEPMQRMGVEIRDPDKVIPEVLDVTSCHPRLMQYFGHQLLAQLGRRQIRYIDLTNLQHVLASTDFREEFVLTIWGDATNLERLITLLVAQGYRTPKAIAEQLASLRLDLSHETLKDALSNLCAYPILEQGKKGDYQFVATHFSEIVRDSQEIELAILGFADKCREENLL